MSHKQFLQFFDLVGGYARLIVPINQQIEINWIY